MSQAFKIRLAQSLSDNLSPNLIFLLNAVFEGIFPFLNLFMSNNKTGSPLMFPVMVPDVDPGYPSTPMALMASDLWSIGMAACSGYVTYQAYDAPDTERTKWAVAAGHVVYHLFVVIKAINGPVWPGPYFPNFNLSYEDFADDYLRYFTLIIHTFLALGFIWWITVCNERHYPKQRVVGLTQEAIEEEERRRREGGEVEEIVTPGAAALEGAKKRK